jgi:homoserine dehydrogenase
MDKIRAALLGFGNVARAFARTATELSIVGVADRTCALCLDRSDELLTLIEHKEAGKSLREYPSAARRLDVAELLGLLLSIGVSVVIESLPTNLQYGQPALGWILTVLSQGIAVVTVDKGPLVCGYDSLIAAARSGGARLAFQGTAGVWPPAAVFEHEVVEIEGILNGTTNHILSGMCESGLGFEEALREAQLRGIAEPDPKLDVDGWDAAAKILILSRALMKGRTALCDVARTGIDATTQRLVDKARSTGRVVRLLARARSSPVGVQLSVAPEIIGPESPFFAVAGTEKAAIFHTAGRDRFFVPGFSGRGSIARIIMDDVRSVTHS